MSSFAPTLIAPAPCRPIPLVRNRHHQHHQSRYQRLSSSSSLIATPPIAASSSSSSACASPLYHPYSSTAATAAAAASLASAFVFPNRPGPAATPGSAGRRSASAGRHSRPGSLGPDYDNKENSAANATTSPIVAFLTAASPPSLLSTLPEKPLNLDDLSSSTDTVTVDHDLTPTRKIMQSFSASMNLGSAPGSSSTSSKVDATPQQQPHDHYAAHTADPRRISSSLLEIPASISSLHAATHSPQLNSGHSSSNSSPALPDSSAFARSVSSPPPTSTSDTPLHPSLIPPSPIPRRLTRNPFARSLSQGGYGLGIAGATSSGNNAAPLPIRSASDFAHVAQDTHSHIFDEPASRFSLDTIGVGLMEIEFDLDSMSADDGGRELLRVERERRKRSFEMHD
ncbi:hypothetical protein A4X13_0g3136 [Tilletia indica]|uniref:Uncharacterized protein n=1 Tax=Tilletia indica TaxID=43049 RepID=A0A177TV08_9BASI|nr:hypothetical protein A4X13_0g3136 [Tilletia indica]